MSSSAACTSSLEKPQAVPIKGGLIPYLQLGGASDAAELYARAFAATEAFRYPVDQSGRTMHIHLYINGSSLMLGDAYPEHGYPLEKPQGYNLTLQVDNIDAWFERAKAAGLDVIMPVQDMFWGARYGQLKDRFGVLWSMNQPL
jgi:PhnB protein